MTSIIAVQKLAPQWAAAGLFLLLKDLRIDLSLIDESLIKIIEPLPNPTLKDEIIAMLPKAKEMDFYDCMLFYDSLQNIIASMVSPQLFPTIFDLCTFCFYNTLIIACKATDPNNTFVNEQSLAAPDMTFPTKFFPFIETALKFLYRVLENQKPTDFSQIRAKIHIFLNNFILHSAEGFNRKRYEGKIYSFLSADPSWFSVIMSRITNLVASIKQKDHKKALILLLRSLKYLRNASQESINELISLSSKVSDEAHTELVSFIAATILHSNAEAPEKFVSSVSKPSPTKKFEYQQMKAIIRLMSKESSKSRHKDFAKLLKSYQKNGSPKVEKLATLTANLLCPTKFPVDLFIKEINKLFFQKGKIPSLSEKRGANVDDVVDVYAAAATKDYAPIVSYITTVVSAFPQIKDQHRTTIFVLKLLAKIMAISEPATAQLVSAMSSFIPTFFSKDADRNLYKAALPCLGAFYKHYPKGQLQLPELIAEATMCDDIDVALACIQGYTYLMKNADVSLLPNALTLSIPRVLVSRINPNTTKSYFLATIDALTQYFETLHANSNGKNIPQIDTTLLAIDSSMFISIFFRSRQVHFKLYRLYSVLVKLTPTYFLGSYFLEHKGTSLRECFLKNEDWFVGIYIKAAEFWVNMDRFTNQNFTNKLLKELFVMARATRKGRKLEITQTLFETALDYIFQMKKEVMISYLEVLHPSVWPIMFAAYEKLYQKYNGQPWHNFLFIQSAFVNNPSFKDYEGPTSIFDQTLENYITTKKSRFEKDIPYEILMLNICSANARKNPSSLLSFANKNINLLNQILDKVNVRELFVINEAYMHAFLDFVGVVFNTLSVDASNINNVINYMIKITEKTNENSTLQSKINECFSGLFKMNKDSRSLIFQMILSSKCSSSIGWSIFNFGIEFSRVELTQFFVIAMSNYQSDPTLAIRIAKRLVGDKLTIGPLSEYDIETESKIWEAIEQNLTDEEVLAYAQLLADSVAGIQRHQNVSLFFTPFLEQNATADDFETVFTVVSSVYQDPSVLLPLQSTIHKIFSQNPQQIPKMFDLMFQDDNNHEAASFVAQLAFKACPTQVSEYLLKKLHMFTESDATCLWDSFEHDKTKAPVSCLSMILALVNGSLKHFESILGQISLYSLYAFDLQVQNNRVPPLLFSILHQLDSSIESFNNFVLDAAICEKLYNSVKQYSKQACEKLESVLIPRELPSNYFFIIKYIGPLVSPASLKPLIKLVVNFAKLDQINNFLLFVPIIIARLNNISDDENTLMFVRFILSFIYYSNDPRLIQTISEALPALIENHCPQLNIKPNIILMTALSTLLLVESLNSPIYTATVSFLRSLSKLVVPTSSKCISTAADILHSLWSLSGYHLDDIRSVDELTAKVSDLERASKSNVLAFLLRLTSSNIIQDYVFRYTIVSFVVKFIGDDLDILRGIEDITTLLLLSTIINDEEISSKYSSLLSYVIGISSDVPETAYDYLRLLSTPISFVDEDTNDVLRIISPEVCEIKPPGEVPDHLQNYIQSFLV